MPLDVFECVLDYIMHNVDMQAHRDPVSLVHSPRRDHNTRRDLHNHVCTHSLGHSRRT